MPIVAENVTVNGATGIFRKESLRAAAERMAEQFPAYRVEIIGGSLVVSRSPLIKHNVVVSGILRQLGHAPGGRIPMVRTAVEEGSGGEDDDYAVPDLVVVAAEVEREQGWLVDSPRVSLAAEVVAKAVADVDTDAKRRLYAAWNIPIYLVVDPRDGSIVLYADPRDGAYQSAHRMRFGDTVVLPEPLKGVRITTEEFPYYDE